MSANRGTAPYAVQRTRRRVLFGVMSSQQPDTTVSQLVDSLDSRPVVVHHDFTKRADFRLSQSNVDFVPSPRVTGWGTWGFVEALVSLLERALTHHDFDYFQLLSPTCLPIRPIEDFESAVSADSAMANVDMLWIDDEPDSMMHFGYRTYAPAGTLRFRLLRRVRSWYFGDDASFVQTHSMAMLKRRRADDGRFAPGPAAALALTRLAAAGAMGRVPFGDAFRPAIASTWFGARRPVCEYFVARVRAPEIQSYFRRLHLVDELVIGNLMANSGFRLGPSHHTVSPFDQLGHPAWIVDAELDRMLATGRFFARKFPEDVNATCRLRAIERSRLVATAA